ncbi:signal recognition particle-docking protein FtsY [Clostridium sp. ASF356]|nr:signal recognition particle-docking protein FtsY [Clostridium sp. MD294]NDO46787.1 signal recognition particle-docking protein FtsY [Clostridium sp. MD294]USF28771.1 Signal recognition particle receptor FtsY [Clostridium sp. MD294]
MGLFDFLKGKKKEETKEIEIKQYSDSIELNDIEIELSSAEKKESTIKLDLVGEDNTTAINQAVHKAIDGEEIELHTATGGKLYQETADLKQVPPLTEEEAKTIQQALTKAVEMSTSKTEELEQTEQIERAEELEQIEKVEQEAEEVSQQIQQAEQEQNTEQTKEKKKGFFAKLFAGLDKTRKNILGGVDNVLGAFTKIDEDLFEELEEVLIMADIGVQTTMNIIENLRKRVKKEHITDPQAIRGMLIEEITAILEEDTQQQENLPSPTVMLVIGVNGVGKTTTIGKLSHNFKEQGKNVLLGAADTFRAAAIDQLEVWGQRAGIDVIKHQENSDPAAVVFDAVNAAKNRNVDLLICDTAGRLHNKKNLMEELKKIAKVIEREYPQAHKEIYLVLDATTGQNAMQQAKLFQEVADITGIILTKLDGTAKGGIVIAIKSELKLPVRYIGVGEGIKDLQKFDAKEFAKALFGE